MNKPHWAWISMVLGLVLAAGSGIGVSAADKAKTTPAEDAAKLQAQKLGAPGAGHRVLEPLAGRWTYTASHWMKPGDKPTETQGTSDNSWILDGRFLKQEVSGTWEGQPFKGLGFIGYDNIRTEYQTVWIDNMMTGIMQGAGTYDAASNTINQSGHFSCPMTGEKALWYRSEVKVKDTDHHTYTTYAKGQDGKEYKSMEITYKRAP